MRPRFSATGTSTSLPLLSAFLISRIPGIFMRQSSRRRKPQIASSLSLPSGDHLSNTWYWCKVCSRDSPLPADQRDALVVRSIPGAPARAQPVQLASLVVVTQSSSFMGLPQYVSLNCGLATCTLPIPFAWRMFISLLFSACSPSLTCQSINVGPRALRNHGIEGVAEHAAGTPVKTAAVAEVAGFFQVAFDEPHVPMIIQLVPDGDGLRGKTTIRESDDRGTTDLQHAPDLSQHFDGPGQVVDGDADAAAVELRVTERQPGIDVEVLDYVGVEALVALQLCLVHAEPVHATVFNLRRQVAYPAAHQI